MLHRLCEGWSNGDLGIERLVEIDETGVCGRRKNMHAKRQP